MLALCYGPCLSTLYSVIKNGDFFTLCYLLHWYYVQRRLWITTFSTAEDVENISIKYDGALHLFEALVQTDTDGSFALFPALEILSLHFNASVKPTPESEKKTAELRLALDVALMELIQLRKQKGVPVKIMHDLDAGSAGLWENLSEFTDVTPFSTSSPSFQGM